MAKEPAGFVGRQFVVRLFSLLGIIQLRSLMRLERTPGALWDQLLPLPRNVDIKRLFQNIMLTLMAGPRVTIVNRFSYNVSPETKFREEYHKRQYIKLIFGCASEEI